MLADTWSFGWNDTLLLLGLPIFLLLASLWGIWFIIRNVFKRKKGKS